MIEWNSKVKLFISDVDQTLAELYTPAVPEIIYYLEKILNDGKKIFLISGQDIRDIQKRIIDQINSELRKNILVGSCSGVEVWGFEKNGELKPKPFYSVYEEKLNEEQKSNLRSIMEKLISEFELKIFPPTTVKEFLEKSERDPFAVMYQDRGPQITFEFVNSYDMSDEDAKKISREIPNTHGSYDFRIPFLERAEKILAEEKIPVTPRLAGEFAVDFAVEGVSKTTAVKFILERKNILSELGLVQDNFLKSESVEIWGDKFSVLRGGTDRHISEALPKDVRSITFRKENPDEFLPSYNIVVWDGEKEFSEGLLEFFKTRYAKN